MSNVLKYASTAATMFVLQACSQVPTNKTSDPTANFVQVSEGLYRGARPDETGLRRLSEMGVRTVLNLEDDTKAVAAERSITDGLRMTEVSKPMSGTSTPDNAQMAEILALLHEKGNYPVFVHCMKGMDRTGVVIALHRVFNEGWSASDANEEMKALGFNTILLALEDYFDEKVGL